MVGIDGKKCLTYAVNVWSLIPSSTLRGCGTQQFSECGLLVDLLTLQQHSNNNNNNNNNKNNNNNNNNHNNKSKA